MEGEAKLAVQCGAVQVGVCAYLTHPALSPRVRQSLAPGLSPRTKHGMSGTGTFSWILLSESDHSTCVKAMSAKLPNSHVISFLNHLDKSIGVDMDSMKL